MQALNDPPTPYVPIPQSAQVRSLVAVQATVWYRPAAHTKQLEHPACCDVVVKKPDAQGVHDVAPPTEYEPARQLEHTLSADAVPGSEIEVPAAQYVCVVHDEARAAEYFPLAQAAHTLTMPPALDVPASQSSHVRSLVAVQAVV